MISSSEPEASVTSPISPNGTPGQGDWYSRNSTAVSTSARITSAKMEGRIKWSPATRMRVLIMFGQSLHRSQISKDLRAMQAGRGVVLEKPGASILESNFGQRAIANLRKNCPVARQRDTKQGAEREANKRAVANDQDAPARVRGRDVAQRGHSTQSCLTGVFAAGHWISHGIGLKAPHLLAKKLLRLRHRLAFDLAEVDLAQTVVDVWLESCRDRSWGCSLAGAIQW